MAAKCSEPFMAHTLIYLWLQGFLVQATSKVRSSSHFIVLFLTNSLQTLAKSPVKEKLPSCVIFVRSFIKILQCSIPTAMLGFQSSRQVNPGVLSILFLFFKPFFYLCSFSLGYSSEHIKARRPLTSQDTDERCRCTYSGSSLPGWNLSCLALKDQAFSIELSLNAN